MKITNEDSSQLILARLDNCKGDISKRWFIFFSVINPYTNKLERKRFYSGINIYSDAKIRYNVAQVIIEEFNKKLITGWNPFHEPNDIYKNAEKVEQLTVSYNRANAALPVYLITALKSKQDLRSKSYKTYRSIVRVFTFYLENKNLERLTINQFTNENAVDFLTWMIIQKKKSAVTRNKYLSLLKNLWAWLIENNYGKINVWENIKKLREIRHGKLPFTTLQVDMLKEILVKENPQLWLFCMFQYYCMIRPGELRMLKVENIHWELQKILIPGEISKNRKSQYVTIPKPFFKMLYDNALNIAPLHYFIFSAYGNTGTEPMSRDYFSKLHRIFLNRLRISNKYSLYSWKHTGNVFAVKAGIGLKDLQMQNRHHDLNTFDIYLSSMGIDDFESLKNNFPAV